MNDLADQRALVTGASRGIGRAVAVQLAAAGARVAVHYRADREAAEATHASLEGDGHLLVQADVADPEQIEAMIEQVVERLGGLDVLVNNAGVYVEHEVTSSDYATWQRIWRETLSINLVGAANAAYLAARHMRENGGGRIVNVGSRGAYRGEPTAPAYGASKAGLHAMSQSLATSLGRYGIAVTAVAPGWVETDMTSETLATERLARKDSEWCTGGVIDVNGASYLR